MTGPEPGGTFAPFRHPAFRAIWTANLASNFGTAIQSVGAAWLMTELTRSHLLIALVQASTTLPIMLLGVFAGAIADNYDRRRVMLAAQAGMLAVSAALALLAWLGQITPAILLALTLALGAGTALNAPAWQASVRQQVGLADLPQAVTLNTISFNLARSVGPAIGGLLLSLWGAATAFAVNAASYVANVVVLSRWHPEPQPRNRRAMLPAIAAGISHCARDAGIRAVLVRGLALGLGISAFHALMPSVAREQLSGGEIDYGLMLGSFGLGSIASALALARLRRRFGMEWVLDAGTLGYIAASLWLAAAPSVAMSLPATFVAGAGWVAILNTLNVAMQMKSPEPILGRCLSIYQAVTFGGMALGAWAWGMLADATRLSAALLSAAAFLAVALAVLRMGGGLPRDPDSLI